MNSENIEQIYPVGWDGTLSPVQAHSKQEARKKMEEYIDKRGYKINLIAVYEPSDSYCKWVENFNIEIIC